MVSITSDGIVTGHGRDLAETLMAEPALQEDYAKDGKELSEREELVDKPSEKVRKATGKLIIEEEVHG